MSVRLGTSFRGRLPFRILDIFCQPRCISHLYKKMAKSTDVQYANTESLRSLLSLDTTVEGRVTFRLFLLVGVVYLYVFH